MIKHTENTKTRRSVRLRGYDYRQPGAYFVTICSYQRIPLFGHVERGSMILNPLGNIVRDTWRTIPTLRPHVSLDEFVVMPNHLHAILLITDVGATDSVALADSVAPTDEPRSAKGPRPGSLGAIIGQFKSVATKRIHRLRSTSGHPIWQRNYFEHIIRHDRALNRIRAYIHQNPARWHFDRYNPDAVGSDQLEPKLQAGL